MKLSELRQTLRDAKQAAPEAFTVPEPEMVNCPSCSGAGKLQGKTTKGLPADWYVDCSACDGSGLCLKERPVGPAVASIEKPAPTFDLDAFMDEADDDEA